MSVCEAYVLYACVIINVKDEVGMLYIMIIFYMNGVKCSSLKSEYGV